MLVDCANKYVIQRIMQQARSQSGGTGERIRVFFIGKKITFKCLQSLKMFCQITKKRFQQPKITTEKPSPENFFLNFIFVFQGEGHSGMATMKHEPKAS